MIVIVTIGDYINLYDAWVQQWKYIIETPTQNT